MSNLESWFKELHQCADCGLFFEGGEMALLYFDDGKELWRCQPCSDKRGEFYVTTSYDGPSCQMCGAINEDGVYQICPTCQGRFCEQCIDSEMHVCCEEDDA